MFTDTYIKTVNQIDVLREHIASARCLFADELGVQGALSRLEQLLTNIPEQTGIVGGANASTAKETP